MSVNEDISVQNIAMAPRFVSSPRAVNLAHDVPLVDLHKWQNVPVCLGARCLVDLLTLTCCSLGTIEANVQFTSYS